ncbi:MAG: response regulator transcription factor [Ferrovibrio sp.]|uniref:response regulator transcription factor n=1 Tax=Ferrovibrio sp. TaxID=1917215 RepID=UPI0026062D16|nr:response regulator transcription factor [Ferrovibrio sp.]MCW0235862.1 response regulator transcription factor [Ferrovibrio sp.]
MTVLNREDATVSPAYAPASAPDDAAARGDGIKVVLVDDDEDYREAVGGELTDLGFEVISLSDGGAMFDYFADGGSSDVILLDWRMPGASGLDLLGQARRRGIMVPVVFLTGMLAASYENAALDGGALDFVNKSRGATILAKRLNLIVKSGKRPPEQQQDELIECGALQLRPQISRAFWHGADVNLTVVEFNIVHLLVRNAGEYVTYRAIYDCVHHVGFIAGAGEDGYRTNVRSSIKRIRNKFRTVDDGFGEIENFLAFGYRWRGAPVSAE